MSDTVIRGLETTVTEPVRPEQLANSIDPVLEKLDQILAELAEIRELYDELINKLDNLDIPYESTLGGGYN